MNENLTVLYACILILILIKRVPFFCLLFHDSLMCFAECQCESEFTDGTCEDLTGRCYCKPNYTGENCDTCAEGYEGFPECYRKSLCVFEASRQYISAEFIQCG